MKELNEKIYNLNFKNFLFYLIYLFIFVVPIYSKKKEKEGKNKSPDNGNDGTYKSFFDNEIDFYIPKYDFQRPYKFQKKGYQDIYRYLNSDSDKNKNFDIPHDIFIFSDDHIKDSDNFYKTEILDNIIKREVNIEDVRLTSDNVVFGYPDAKFFDESPKLIKDDDVVIKNFADMGVNLAFTPNNLVINDK